MSSGWRLPEDPPPNLDMFAQVGQDRSTWQNTSQPARRSCQRLETSHHVTAHQPLRWNSQHGTGCLSDKAAECAQGGSLTKGWKCVCRVFVQASGYNRPASPAVDDWEIDIAQLQIDAKVASGAFSNLYRGSYCGQEVAVKILKDVADDTTQYQEFLQVRGPSNGQLGATQHACSHGQPAPVCLCVQRALEAG